MSRPTSFDIHVKEKSTMATIQPRPCPYCSKEQEAVEVDRKPLEAWLSGHGLVQDVFPTFTDSQRESILTGICDECWDNLFGEEGDA